MKCNFKMSDASLVCNKLEKKYKHPTNINWCILKGEGWDSTSIVDAKVMKCNGEKNCILFYIEKIKKR